MPSGPRHGRWKGGIRKSNGRVLVLRPDHPNARADGYIYRYRLVASEMLGRPLRPDEIVHHIDGDKANDHPSNLLVTTPSEHSKKYDARKPLRGVVPDKCFRGHPLTVENTRLRYPNGRMKWRCKACDRERYRIKKERGHGIVQPQ